MNQNGRNRKWTDEDAQTLFIAKSGETHDAPKLTELQNDKVKERTQWAIARTPDVRIAQCKKTQKHTALQ